MYCKMAWGATCLLTAPNPVAPHPISQMELQLGELVDELSGRLPEAGVRALDELMAQLDEVEERLESLKVRPRVWMWVLLSQLVSPWCREAEGCVCVYLSCVGRFPHGARMCWRSSRMEQRS